MISTLRDWTSARLHELRVWTKLSAEDRRLLVQTMVLVLAIRLGLELFSLRRVRQWLGQPRGSADPQAGAVERYQDRVIWAVHAVGHRILGDRPCLPQALAAQWLLGQNGIPTTFHIGAAKDRDNRLLAHAWLERDGRIIVGGSTSRHRYVKFEPFVERSDS